MSILLDGGKKTGRGTLKGIAAVAKRGNSLSLSLSKTINSIFRKAGWSMWRKQAYICGRSGYVYKEKGSTNWS